MKKKQYCILRTRTINNNLKITQCAKHNFRLRTQRNIDPTQTTNNKILVNELNVDPTKSEDLQEKLHGFYEELGVKQKKGNVLMMEWLVTASPEFFYEKTEKEIEKWANAQVDFMRKEFGQQLKLGILHLDEKTPHIHFMVSTEQFTEKKYKNQKGEFFKKTWSLNAKRYNPDFLVKLQDRFALANKRFGLYRGARGSKKKNLPLKDFYKVVDTIKEIDMKPVVEHYLKDVAIDVPLWKRTESYLKELFIEAISPILKKLVNDHNKLRKFVETNWVDLQENNQRKGRCQIAFG